MCLPRKRSICLKVIILPLWYPCRQCDILISSLNVLLLQQIHVFLRAGYSDIFILTGIRHMVCQPVTRHKYQSSKAFRVKSVHGAVHSNIFPPNKHSIFIFMPVFINFSNLAEKEFNSFDEKFNQNRKTLICFFLRKCPVFQIQIDNPLLGVAPLADILEQKARPKPVVTAKRRVCYVECVVWTRGAGSA